MALSRPWAEFKAGPVTWWINREFDRPDLRLRLEDADALMTERIARDAAPRNTEVARAEWNGDRLEVVRPVAAKGNPRAALAWVTISPTTEFNGSSLVVTAPVVVISLLLGWIVATWLIISPTQRGSDSRPWTTTLATASAMPSANASM